MPPAEASAWSTRTPGLRPLSSTRFGRGPAQRELFLLASYIDAARPPLAWGLGQTASPRRTGSSRVALEGSAGELAGNAPALADGGTKRVIAALLRAEGELAGGAVEAELIELRRASFRLARPCARGMRAFAERARPARWRGE